MRGRLLLAAARVPYMRASLSWPAAEPHEGDPRKQAVDLRDLDGADLVELVQDPVVTILGISDATGAFRKITIEPTVTADQAQMMIDAIIDELPPREEEFFLGGGATGEDLSTDAFDLARVAMLLTDRGFADIEEMVAAHDRDAATLTAIAAIAEANRGDGETLVGWVQRLVDAGAAADKSLGEALAEIQTAKKAATDLADQAKAHVAKVAELEAENAKLKAAPKPPKAPKAPADKT